MQSSSQPFCSEKLNSFWHFPTLKCFFATKATFRSTFIAELSSIGALSAETGLHSPPRPHLTLYTYIAEMEEKKTAAAAAAAAASLPSENRYPAARAAVNAVSSSSPLSPLSSGLNQKPTPPKNDMMLCVTNREVRCGSQPRVGHCTAS